MDLRKHAARGAVLIAALAGSFALASPAMAVTPGAFCSKADHFQTAYHNGKAYQCLPDAGTNRWRWHTTNVPPGEDDQHPSPTPTPVPPGDNNTEDGDGTGTKLPVTGAGATTAALAGGGLLTAGVGAVVLTRRRRRFVA